jgi:hypothetical protein
MSDKNAMSDKKDNSGEVNRRRLLRGAGAAVAGAVGAGVAASVATPANAASGDNVVLGHVNDAGVDTTNNVTTIQNTNGNDAALVLNNPDGPTLTLGATSALPTTANDTLPGSFIADQYGNMFTNQAFTDGNNYYTRVFTDGWATQVVPITPVRALDTRDPKYNGSLLSSSRDSTGRLNANSTAILDISNMVNGGVAAQLNVTVVNGAAAGFVTVWSGAGTRPTASTVNYNPNDALSNFSQTELAGILNDPAHHDVFGIFTSRAVHVIIDVVGFIVFSAAQVSNLTVKSAKIAKPDVAKQVARINAIHQADRPQIQR